MIKKLLKIFIIVTIVLCPVIAEEAYTYVEMEHSKKLVDINTSKYNQLFAEATKLVKTNNLYIAKHYKNNAAAYIYACSRRGDQKIYMNIKRNKDKLDISVKATTEGPYSDEEATKIADELAEKFLKDLAKKG